MAVTRHGTDARLYIDGQLGATATVPAAAINSDSTFALGARSYKSGNNWSYGFFFRGAMADVRLWNYARSAAEIDEYRYTRLSGSEPGLIGYWPLDEGSGATINSKATPNYTGALNYTTWSSDNALVFYGSQLKILPPFLMAQPLTGSTRFTNTNEVLLVSFDVPDGCTHYQFNTNDNPDAVSPAGWLPVTPPPETILFARPPATARITQYLWFTNTSASSIMQRSKGTIIYTDSAMPTSSVRSDVTFMLDRGAPVVVNGHNLNNNSDGGKALGYDIPIFSFTPLFVSGPGTNATPGANVVTLHEPGDYSLKAVAMNEAGNVATSGVAAVHVRSGSEHGASFNGTSSYINIGTNRHGALANFTLSAWIKTASRPEANPNGYARNGAIAGQGYLGGYNYGYGLSVTGDSIDGGVDFASIQLRYAYTLYTVSTPFNFDGLWHHLAAVRDGTNLLLYLDGRLAGAATVPSGSFLPEQRFYIGEVDSGAGPFKFKGVIANVQLWGRALSAPFIRETMNMRLQGGDEGLLGYWPLNEGTGSTAWDHTGKGNNGTMTSVTWTTPDSILNAMGTLPDFFNAAPFIIADALSGNRDYTSATNVNVTVFPAPSAYTHCQVTTGSLSTAITSGAWTPLSAPPQQLAFALPATNAFIRFYTWFTNDLRYAYLSRAMASISYLAPLIPPEVPPSYARQLVPGMPVTIYPDELAPALFTAARDSGLPLAGSLLFISGDSTNRTPGNTEVTVGETGVYNIKLVVADVFGRAVTSAVCQVTVSAWAGDPFEWRGAASRNWDNWRNWNLGSLPCMSADVIISNSNADILLTTATPRLKSLAMNNGKLTVSGWSNAIDAATITLTNCTISHLPNTATAAPWTPNHRIHLRGDTINIASGAVVSASKAGFSGGAAADGKGPGGGKYAASAGGGGGHGGHGGRNGSYGAGGVAYGNLEKPDMPGSGGGGFAQTTPPGRGGGVIRIEAREKLNVNGVIAANGETPPGNNSVGGGSGGSIWITAYNVAGTGAITAHGGNGGIYSGAGAGGRIAIWRVIESPGSTLHTTTLANKGSGSNQNDLENGTVYWGRYHTGTIFLLQ